MRPADFQTSAMRVTMMIVFTGAWTVGIFRIAANRMMPEGWKPLLWASIAVAPFMGLLLHSLFEWVIRRFFSGPFSTPGGRVEPGHSIGEALVKRAEYQMAADWFSQQAVDYPKDWKAQERLIEIVAGHLDDPDRLAEARARLLKLDGVPEGLWARTALELGTYWEEQRRPDRAINVYKTLLWKIPEGYDAEEAQQRIRRIENPEGPQPESSPI
jgi:tetratricopeptide (TPR) repeat protein